MRKIAIIEDTKDNLDLLYYLLRDEFEIARYASGEEALADFAQNAPDLIVLDIWLPGIDGVEVLKRVRQYPALAAIPIVALTADAMWGGREKYLAAGFDAYTSKPIVDVDDFLATIRSLLKKRPN